MTHPLSRLMSAATAAYGVYALARPGHLGQALQASRRDRPGLDLVARTYGARDLAISSVALASASTRSVRTAMMLRIAMDLADAAVLATWTSDPQVRRKVLAVTLGWAGANAAALAVDTSRSHR